jgi:hypothetical protein
MPKPKLTLWLLNRIVDWDHERLKAALSDHFDVKLGRRVVTVLDPTADSATVDVAVNQGLDGVPGELMFESGKMQDGSTVFDEYFVPIPIKCVGNDLGSTFWRGCLSQRGEVRFHELKAHLAARFERPFNPGRAKATIGRHFGDVQMNLLDRSLGYYEILQRAKSQNDNAMNMLVGYSQGGTVARYLAFLDEQVVDPSRRCIHCVVTVQSPNRGSPVAAVAKSTDVLRAMLAILLSLPKWLPPDFRSTPLWTFLAGTPGTGGTLAAVNGLLDSELDSWPEVSENERLRETWLTARKWLSGLSGVEDLAFWDLDPARLAQVGSVLQAINDYPLASIRHGAVIGSDNRLANFAKALLHDAPWYVRLLVWFKSGTVRDLLAQADGIYKDDAMSLPTDTPGSLAVEYRDGVPKGRYQLDTPLPAGAHDFVIPSASQLLIPGSNTGLHLGNIVNADASHLTGAVEWKSGDGETDEEHVLEILRRI